MKTTKIKALIAGIALAIAGTASAQEVIDISSDTNKGCVWDVSEANGVTSWTVTGCESGQTIIAAYTTSDPGETFRYTVVKGENTFTVGVVYDEMVSFEGYFENGCQFDVMGETILAQSPECAETLVVGNQPAVFFAGGMIAIFNPFTGEVLARF